MNGNKNVAHSAKQPQVTNFAHCSSLSCGLCHWSCDAWHMITWLPLYSPRFHPTPYTMQHNLGDDSPHWIIWRNASFSWSVSAQLSEWNYGIPLENRPNIMFTSRNDIGCCSNRVIISYIYILYCLSTSGMSSKLAWNSLTSFFPANILFINYSMNQRFLSHRSKLNVHAKKSIYTLASRRSRPFAQSTTLCGTWLSPEGVSLVAFWCLAAVW